MKELLLASLLLTTPVAGSNVPNHADVSHMNFDRHVVQHITAPVQQVSAPQGLDFFDQWQQKIMQDFQTLQSLFTHTRSQSQPIDINQQLDQILKDMNTLNQMLDQNMIRDLGIRKLPRPQLPSNGQGQQGQTPARQQQQGNILVAAGDAGVSNGTLQSAGQMIEKIALPILESNLSKRPAQGTEITLFSNKRSYMQALLQAGAPRDEVQLIASNTGGLTIGNQIWIPLYNLHNQGDLTNVLTHELTHVVFNQQGIGENLPTWINEGVAMHDGMTAFRQADAATADKLSQASNQQVAAASQQGALLPLSASESDILRASYNVEWVDYLAVENLIQTYGEEKFHSFLAGIPQLGVEKAFEQQFGKPMSQFEQEFHDSL